MVNFTNLRSKALSLVALMALSSTAVFAQSGKSNFETATDAASLKGAKKIFLYDGDKQVGFPVENGTLVKGVSLAIQEEGGMAIDATTGLFKTGANVGDLAFEKIPQLSPNDLNASYWFGNDGKLNIFTRKAQATAVLDFSTKYLHNVRNLSMTLGENRMGSTPSLKTQWHVVAFIYNLDGTKAPLKGIYKSHAGVEENYFEVEFPYSVGTKAVTAVADTTITLFVNDKDGATEDLIPYSLDNKIIRVAIYSDMPKSVTPGSGGHFLPALTIADCGIEFDKPSISLAVDAWDFNAGACGISEQEGKLTFAAKNVSAPEGVKVPVLIEGNAGFTNDFSSFVYGEGKAADSVKYDASYVFTPEGISEGAFFYKATVNADKKDVLSPIKLSATHEKAIAFDSKPVVTLAEDHVKFDGPREVKRVTITGKNVPVFNFASGKMVDYAATEKKSSDQTGKYADLVVTEVFDIAANGDIVKTTGAVPYLNLAFDQKVNDISRDEAFLVSAKDWTVTLCNGEEYTGAGFQTLIARGNVAQLWFTYMGKSVIGTPSITPDNVFFSRHDASQPYDDARYASRVKKYMLHGTAVTATADNNMATINVNLQVGKLGAAGQDHLEMRYSLTDPASAEFTGWTNATIKPLQITLNTADQAAIENFLTNGIPVYVQYVPRCDGFTQGADATTEAGFTYGWNPHEFVLSAAVNDNGVSNTETTVNLYGDTRAALTSSMNELHSLYVMGGTQTVSPIGEIVNDWMTGAQADGSVVVPAFRKSYGDIYNGCESSLYWKVDSFMVAGYNLKKAVALTQTHNTKYDGAFSTEVRMLAGTTDGATLTPNNYGELVALVKVYFAQNPIDKKAGLVKAEDVLTVSTDEATLVMKGQEKRANYVDAGAKQYYDFFKIGGNVNNTPDVAHNTVNGFNYTAYSEGAEVFGFIYKPTLTFNFTNGEELTKELTAAVGKDTTAQFWVRGSEFNPMDSRAVTLKLKLENTPFSIAPVTGSKKAAINDAGSFAELYQVTYAPGANLCEKENTIQFTSQCATALEAKLSGIPTWNASSLKLNPLDHGDIHGSMAKISWTPVAGAAWYQVEVGHWKPLFTSDDVFISECKAAEGSDQIVVEVFNGTGKVINKNMMVNYYLQFEQFDAVTGKMIGTADIPAKGSNLDNELLNTNVTVNGWSYDAVKYVYTAPINNKYTYNVKLMQGGIQIDIFSFGQAGAHLARTAAAVRDGENKIKEAATIERNDGKFDQSAWETFNTSLPIAHFEWKEYSYFDMKDGGRSEMIEKTSTTINNLKANTDYDVRVSAYNDCIIGGADGLRIPISKDSLNFLNMSELVTSSGNIEFSDEIGWPTGNGPIEVSAVNVYANDGKIFVAGAEGNVTICNILGAAVAQVSAETATQGIAVNAGVYVVRVNGEKGVKCIVK